MRRRLPSQRLPPWLPLPEPRRPPCWARQACGHVGGQQRGGCAPGTPPLPCQWRAWGRALTAPGMCRQVLLGAAAAQAWQGGGCWCCWYGRKSLPPLPPPLLLGGCAVEGCRAGAPAGSQSLQGQLLVCWAPVAFAGLWCWCCCWGRWLVWALCRTWLQRSAAQPRLACYAGAGRCSTGGGLSLLTRLVCVGGGSTRPGLSAFAMTCGNLARDRHARSRKTTPTDQLNTTG